MFNFMEKVSEATIEKLFLDIIKDFSTANLTWATENDASLLLMTQQNSPKLLRTASGLAKGFKGCGHYLNSTNMLLWLKEKRPEIHTAIILNPKKKAWMQKQIEDFRRFLFS